MPPNGSGGNLELSISTERVTNYLDEPLYLVARLSNTGSESLPVPPPRIEPSGIPSNIGLSFKSVGGKMIQPLSREKTGGIELSDRGDELSRLLPGSSWVVVVDLLAAYGRGHDRGNMVFRRGRLDKGEYDIEAFYKASFAHSGIIRSGPLRIIVKNPPLGDRSARQKIFKAHTLYRSDSTEPARRKAIKLYEEAIRKHPRSRYLPDAYRMLVELSREQTADTIKGRVYEAQTKYSDPVFLYDLTMHLEETDQMNREELIDLFYRIRWRLPRSVFAEIVGQRLKFEETIGKHNEGHKILSHADTNQARSSLHGEGADSQKEAM